MNVVMRVTFASSQCWIRSAFMPNCRTQQ